MSDFDETVFSSRGPAGTAGGPQQPAPEPQKPKKRNRFLIIGGIGCALLLCAALLIGGGSYYLISGADLSVAGLMGDEEATATVPPDTPTPEPPTPTMTFTPTLEAEDTETASESATGEAESTAGTGTPTVGGEPEIGEITFALGATDEYEPVDPGETFEEGIIEIHAIFDYSGMSPGITWERVWYLDGEEILRNSAEWTDPIEGRFDYFLDAGGAPLPVGEWALEIYVEDELLAESTFAIEGEEPEMVAQVESTPTTTPSPTVATTATLTPTATTSSPAASGGGTFQMVYSKWDGGQHNMYVADTNGNNERFLLGRAAGPSWTPDKQQIFFYGQEGVDRQELADGREFVFDGISNGIVAMVNASAMPSPEAAILFQPNDWKFGSARWASVSPNGQMVAFDARPSGDYRIYFLGTSDNQQFRFEILGEQASWSPDSEQVVYRSGRDGRTGIWISNRDDSGHTLITDNGSDSFPAWSPNGRTIAFAREADGNLDIYTMNVDGSNVQRLTTASGPDSLPTYTPSGDIIFRSARSGSWGIWKMSGAGANQQEIIPNAGVGPDWAYSKMDVR